MFLLDCHPRETRRRPGRPWHGRGPVPEIRAPSSRTVPLVGSRKPADDVEDRRLTTTRRAHETHELVLGDGQVHRPQAPGPDRWQHRRYVRRRRSRSGRHPSPRARCRCHANPRPASADRRSHGRGSPTNVHPQVRSEARGRTMRPPCMTNSTCCRLTMSLGRIAVDRDDVGQLPGLNRPDPVPPCPAPASSVCVPAWRACPGSMPQVTASSNSFANIQCGWVGSA